MSIETMDFQSIVHQQVTGLIEGWKAEGFTEEDIQDCASQMFNMGIIASQQVQQEGGIQPQGSQQKVPYTPEMAERVVMFFLFGLNAGVMKSHEMKLPSQEKWQMIQQVAYHVFEHSKQAIIATLGQESTPDVQISDEQILNWLTQTAVEALLYYVNEHEKQYGPITRTDEVVMEEEFPLEEPVQEQMPVQEEFPMEEVPEEVYQPVAAPAAQVEPPPQQQQRPQQPAAQTGVPDIHHKYAAVALFVSALSTTKQKRILSAFRPEEQQLIQQYRDPDVISRNLDLGRVAKYLKQFAQKMGQSKPVDKSKYASRMSSILETLPPHRLERLFQSERPYVRGYVNQFTRPSDRDLDPYTLPTGVEESLFLYLERNFPSEVTTR